MRGFGNRKCVSIAGKAAVSHDYEVKNGNLLKSIYANGWEVAYTYDANDCLIKEVQTTPDGVRTVTRGYDADSRETVVTCGSVKVEKTFDKLGRLLSIRRNGGKHTTTYTYGTAADGGQTGRIKTVKNGSGTWEYAYDAWGNVSKAIENGSADRHTYTYDASGIRTSKKVNGITTEYLTAGGSVLSEKKKNLKKVIYCF